MDKCTQVGAAVPITTGNPNTRESRGAGKADPGRACGPRGAGRRESASRARRCRSAVPKAPGRTGWAAQPRVCSGAGPQSPATASPAPGTRWGDDVTPSVTPAPPLGDRAPLALGTPRRVHGPGGCGKSGAGCRVTCAFCHPVSPARLQSPPPSRCSGSKRSQFQACRIPEERGRLGAGACSSLRGSHTRDALPEIPRSAARCWIICAANLG